MILARDVSPETFTFWCYMREFIKNGLLLAGAAALLAWSGKDEKK